jgi:hypothetical protein
MMPFLQKQGYSRPAKMKTTVKQIQTSPETFAPARDFLIRRIFAPAMIACGLGLTVVWISLFGYGLIKLLEFAV